MTNKPVYSVTNGKIVVRKGKKYWLFLLWYVSWILYFAHVMLENNIVTKVALGVVLSYNLFFASISLFQNYSKQIKYFSTISLILLLIFSVYCLFAPDLYYSSFNQEWIGTFGNLKLEWFTLGSVFPAIYYAHKGFISERLLSWTLPVLVTIGVASYYFQLSFLINKNGIDAMNVNNMGYLLATVMVYLPLIKNKILSLILLVICVTLSLLSLKRGAMLIAMTCMMIIFFYWTYTVSEKKKFLRLILFILFYLIGLYFINDLYHNSDLIQARLENTVSTGARGEIWNKLIDAQLTGPFYNFVFGNGFIATISKAGNYAHNEWLEIFYDYGIMGLFIYFMFYVCIIKAFFYCKEHMKGHLHITIYALLIISLFLKSVFSMFIDGAESVAPIVLLSYLMVVTYERKKKNTFIYR